MSLSEKTSDAKVHQTISRNDGEVEDIDSHNMLEYKQTKRHLLPRHIQLIAISGAIGTGLFVSTMMCPYRS